jgi:hypothetical protein
MSQQLPASVLSRLRNDEKEVERQLASGQLPETVQTVKQATERKLLSITGKAVDTLEEVMDYGAPKERVAAASKVIDISPATKPQIAGTTNEQSIPLDAVKELFMGMGKMFGQMVDFKHSEIKRAKPLPEPEPVIAPKRGRKPKA